MDQPQQTPSPSSRPPEGPPQTAETASHPLQSLQQHQPPSSNANSFTALPTPSSTAPPSPSLAPNPNPAQISRPMTSPSQQQHQHQHQHQQQILSQSLTRPPSAAYSRPWQHHSTFSHFSSPLTTTSSPLLSSSSVSGASSPSLAVSGQQRGGMAIGVPASPLQSPSPPSPSQPSAFPGSYGQHFGGLGRGAVGVSESTTNSNVSQARPMQGMQGIGMIGALGSGSQMRPSGMSMPQHQQRPVQSSLRPISSPSNQPPAGQNFQGHNLMRASSVGSPGVQSTSTPQSTQPLNQPWLSSSAQGKPPLPPSSFRPQVNPPSMQQRAHIPQQQQQPQQHPPTPTTTSQPQQQQSLPQHQPQEQLHQPQGQLHQPQGQLHQPQGQLQSLRSPQQPLSHQHQHQHQLTRVQGPVNQKPTSQVTVAQPSVAQPGIQGKTVSAENEESGNHVLGKRSIHELLQQIDSSEKLGPEVADILVDIAEDFAVSIITSGCSLAKHRKSDTLEARDILLHVERNWNMRPPGFSGDEIKTYRKPLTTDIHKERLAAVKKTIMATEAANSRNPIGQGTANAKGGHAKTPANILASPPFNR